MGEEASGGYDFDFLSGAGGGDDEYEGRVAEWEAGLPGCDELTPLSQPLVPPGLAAAFRIPPEPGRTLLDVHRASSATVSRLRSSKSSSPSGPNGTGGGSFPSFPGSKEGDQDTNGTAESAGEKSGAGKRARLVWTPQLHKRFVDVVAHLGIKAAVPKTIMQLMNVDGLTRENVASHLQKYRQYVGRSSNTNSDRASPSDDNIFASTPVPHTRPAAAPMPPAVYHHPAPMTMGGHAGYYHQQQHSGHAVYNGYGGGAVSSYHQYHHGDRYELTPLSQPLVPPGLAAAFRIPPEPGRTLLDVHRASSATVSRLRSSKSSSPSGPNGGGGGGGSFPSFPGSAASNQDTNGTEESAGDKSGAAKRARLVWTPQLHKRFVDVVAHLGIKAAVPKTIMQLMNVDGLTRENVASHLQKYRQYVGRSSNTNSDHRASPSDDNIFASTPVPAARPAPMPPAVYHHPAPMTMGGHAGYYHQQQHSGHAVYNGYGGGHGHAVSSYHQYNHQ